MANLYFPQLSSGALAQYPIRKLRLARTVKNVLADGSMLVFPDPDGARLFWELSYTSLSTGDVQALQNHFASCLGPYHAFTFIDPTDNMLRWSTDLRETPWNVSSQIQLSPGLGDPDGGTAGFMAVNTSQASQQISQTLAVPAGYQYCLSLYAMSSQPGNLVLTRAGATTQQATSANIGFGWSRIVSQGQLNDTGTSITVSITLAPGQEVRLYGLQLEPQIAPTRYRPTTQIAGVYANAHWAVDQLKISADAPNLFSTSFSIETAA